ncbi:MAG: S41 family peptidase [Candidatus Latescibacteria bacterium]|nr:S41 family peptidase [Candidatus Latescibacterota bacterium]
MRKISFNISILIVLLFLAVFPQNVKSQDYPSDFMDIFQLENAFLKVVREAYVDTISGSELYQGAIDGMIKKLDPHSSFLPKNKAEEFTEKIRGNFQGVGITFALLDDKITVIESITGGPSEKAGIISRDRIVKIDDKDAIGIDEETVREKLRGEPGSKVNVHVERPGEEKLLKFTITRESINLDSVSHSYMIDDTTGYIALTRFTINTQNDVGNALSKLKAMGMRRLILDLRNNSGGSLDAAVGVVNFFINKGVIVYTKGKQKEEDKVWEARDYGDNQSYCDIPLIVMINHGSASASEIVSGALQDHDRALIVGQTSFGKGLVMNQYPLRNSLTQKDFGTLVLSVARYYTPSDRLIQRPYDNGKDQYIKEGLDDIDPNAADSSKAGRPIYFTDLGRKVYGGGGITPDVTIEPSQRLNTLERNLRSTHVFFEFADDYLLKHNDIPKYFEDFLLQYNIPEAELDRFKEFALKYNENIKDDVSPLKKELEELLQKHNIEENSRNIVLNSFREAGIDLDESLFQISSHFIEREIKQEIARMIWGSEARYRIWHTDDTELITSLSYFDEASDLLTRRLAIGDL